VSLADYFGFDIDSMSIDASPRFEQRLISEDDDFMVVQDRVGYTIRKAKGKSRTFEVLEHMTHDRASWERVKERFVIGALDSARIDDASYFLHMDEYPSWAGAREKYEKLRRQDRYLLFAGYGGYEFTWRHRGYEELLMETASDPDFVAEMTGAYMDFLITVLQRCLDEGMKPDGFFLVEDVACTRGMLFSPRSWREILKPHMYALGQFLHNHGIAFWMHCCGNAEAIFDDLIECGLDVIQPLEAKSGLDVRKLRPVYGDRLTFYGNIDVRVMADGTDEEMAEEIRSKLAPFKADGGGYIYHSDHSVPPEVSLDRFRLALDLVRRYGTY
jgi:uroporphyrinogen decarboxylase